MADPIHVTCVTTSRADYGLIRWPMLAMSEAADFRLSVIVGGGHLAGSHDISNAEIEADGFVIAERVPMYLDTEARSAAAIGTALAVQGTAQAFSRLDPDWVLVLGDRFEMLGVALAASTSLIPICHLCGGDITEGAFDDSFRHAISKLAHLHGASTAQAAARLRQMGEEDWRISVTGSPGLDALHHVPRCDRATVFEALDLDTARPVVLATYHPETLAADFGIAGLDAMLSVLDQRPELQILFTGTNADPGGALIAARIDEFISRTDRARFRTSLGHTRFIQTVPHMAAVIGNSSSGLYEVPSLGTPTVNIGRRQAGRLRAASVFDAEPTEAAIKTALDAALARSGEAVENPYGDGHASAKILDAIRLAGRDRSRLLNKRFSDLSFEAAR